MSRYLAGQSRGLADDVDSPLGDRKRGLALFWIKAALTSGSLLGSGDTSSIETKLIQT
jgi:hypothetical protein